MPRAERIVGEAIYAALGVAGAQEIDHLIGRAISAGRSVNYVLRFPLDCTGLAALPWELLRGPRGNLLMRPGGNDSLERYVVLGLPPPLALPEVERPHALVLLPHFAMSPEDRAVELALFERLRKADALTFDTLSPVTWDSLVDYMRNTPQAPHIVHYAGHGTYRDQEGWLLLDGSDRHTTRVSAEHFSAVLGRARLAVILACQSAMVAEGELLTGVAPSLSQAVAAVVAMQLTVRADEAHRFASVFYEELLLKRESLQLAVSRGRQALSSLDASRASWHIPTLYIRTHQGQIVSRKAPAQFSVRTPRPRPKRPTIDPIEIDGLHFTLSAEASEGQWRLEVTNMTEQAREGLSITISSLPRGIIIQPIRIHVPRVPANSAAAPVPVTITFTALSSEISVPFSLFYRISGTRQPGRHNAAFVLRPASSE